MRTTSRFRRRTCAQHQEPADVTLLAAVRLTGISFGHGPWRWFSRLIGLTERQSQAYIWALGGDPTRNDVPVCYHVGFKSRHFTERRNGGSRGFIILKKSSWLSPRSSSESTGISVKVAGRRLVHPVERLGWGGGPTAASSRATSRSDVGWRGIAGGLGVGDHSPRKASREGAEGKTRTQYLMCKSDAQRAKLNTLHCSNNSVRCSG